MRCKGKNNNQTIPPLYDDSKPSLAHPPHRPFLQSNPVRNLDKRTARRTYRSQFLDAIADHVSADGGRLDTVTSSTAHATLHDGGSADTGADDDADADAAHDPPRASSSCRLPTAMTPTNDALEALAGTRVFVRKRPIHDRELKNHEFDVVTSQGAKVTLHDARMHADMQNMVLHHHSFYFHGTFNAAATNGDVYNGAVRPMIALPLHGGVATILAYGQTGSGKTFTMTSIYNRAAQDLFETIAKSERPGDITVSVSYLEVSHKNCADLLGEGKPVKLVDSTAVGAVEVDVQSADQLSGMIAFGQRVRSTSQTGVHDASSRSHSVLRVYVQAKADKKRGTREKEGMLVLVDLAGSERSIDSLHHNAQRTKEAAQINASLMALKGCILARAAGKDASHQYRKSKLTMVLKPSFFFKDSQTTILATVSPSSKDTEHSLNTLRHACIMNGSGQIVDDRVEVANCGEVEVQQVGRINVYAERIRQIAEQKKQAASGGSGAFARDSFRSNGNESGEKFGEVLTDRQLEKMRKKSERKAMSAMAPDHKVLLLEARSSDNAHKQQTRAWLQRQKVAEAAGEGEAAAEDTRQLKYGDGGGGGGGGGVGGVASSPKTSRKIKMKKAKQKQQQQRFSKWDEPDEGGGSGSTRDGAGSAVESHGAIPVQSRGSRRPVQLREGATAAQPSAPPPGSPNVSRHDRARATRERIAAERKASLLARRDGSATSSRSASSRDGGRSRDDGSAGSSRGVVGGDGDGGMSYADIDFVGSAGPPPKAPAAKLSNHERARLAREKRDAETRGKRAKKTSGTKRSGGGGSSSGAITGTREQQMGQLEALISDPSTSRATRHGLEKRLNTYKAAIKREARKRAAGGGGAGGDSGGPAATAARADVAAAVPPSPSPKPIVLNAVQTSPALARRWGSGGGSGSGSDNNAPEHTYGDGAPGSPSSLRRGGMARRTGHIAILPTERGIDERTIAASPLSVVSGMRERQHQQQQQRQQQRHGASSAPWANEINWDTAVEPSEGSTLI